MLVGLFLAQLGSGSTCRILNPASGHCPGSWARYLHHFIWCPGPCPQPADDYPHSTDGSVSTLPMTMATQFLGGNQTNVNLF